jgi:hypothetical protein
LDVDTTEAWTTHMNGIYEEKLDGLRAGSRYQYVKYELAVACHCVLLTESFQSLETY